MRDLKLIGLGKMAQGGKMVSQEVSFNDVHRTKLQGTYIKKIMLKQCGTLKGSNSSQQFAFAINVKIGFLPTIKHKNGILISTRHHGDILVQD